MVGDMLDISRFFNADKFSKDDDGIVPDNPFCLSTILWILSVEV